MKMTHRALAALLAASLMGSPFMAAAQDFDENIPETIPNQEHNPNPAAIAHSGKLGTATWTLDNEGTLRIGAGEFSTNNPDYSWPWKPYAEDIRHVDGTAKFVAKGDFSDCFYPGMDRKCAVESADLSGWDVSSVTSLAMFFGDCPDLASVSFNGWDTSNVTIMSGLFRGCSSLEAIDFPDTWDTSSVTDLSSMFTNCASLRKLDLNSWNTGSVRGMNYTFSGCGELRELGIDKWDVSSLTSANQMFSDCIHLTSLDFSAWRPVSLGKLFCMFAGCRGLATLNISGWPLPENADIDHVFSGCSAIETVTYTESARPLLSQLRGAHRTIWSPDGTSLYSVDTLPALSDGQSGTIVRQAPAVVSITKAQVNGLNKQYSWTGRAIVPDLTLTVEGLTLKKSIDYTMNVTNNIHPGIATIRITGKEDYCDEIELSFEIVKMEQTDLSSANIEIDGLDSSYEATGSPITPQLNVKADGNALIKDQDYTISYADNTKPGTATITITGQGEYTGSITRTFTITEPKKELIQINTATVSGIQESYIFNNAPITPAPAVTLNNNVLEAGKDYTVSFANNDKPGQATVTITGIGEYTGTITRTFQIQEPKKEPVSIAKASVTGIVSTYVWSHKPVTPSITITLDGRTLTKDKDYTLAFTNNNRPGKATITITGIGDYTGSISRTFTIEEPKKDPVDLSKASIAGIEARYAYTGKPIAPTPVITVNDTVLMRGTDYTLAYANNTKPGKARLTITGKGSYTGVRTITFEIVDMSSKPGPEVKAISMYRLYNPNSGEHFYTAAKAEKEHLVKVGWNDEGIGWKAPETSNKPVYRLYNANAGDHHYTMNKEERDHLIRVGWKDEGIGWYSDEAEGIALYRQYNPNAKAGSHNYTTNKKENDHLVKVGWREEGIGWYGVKAD